MKFYILALLTLLPVSLASPVPVSPLSPRAPLTVLPVVKRQTALNRFLDFLLDHVPAINGHIENVSGVLTAFENLLAILTWQQTTYNDLNNGVCKEYTLIFARGTTEPGNVGILVGPPFIEALRERVGKNRLAVQGVNGYDADVEGYLNGGDSGGSASLVSQLASARAKCPNTKLILSGYSQGGMIIHNAAQIISDATASWISKVVIFGDPYSLKPVAKIATNKVKIYCHIGDAICINGALILPPHLTYGIDARSAAAFATT